jgi:hypothetical protein
MRFTGTLSVRLCFRLRWPPRECNPSPSTGKDVELELTARSLSYPGLTSSLLTHLRRSPYEASGDLRMNYFDSEMWYLEEPMAAPGQGKSQGRCHNPVFLHHQSRSGCRFD